MVEQDIPSSLEDFQVPPLSTEVKEYLSKFADIYPVDTVLAFLDSARPLKVLVVGETIIDEYQYCRAIGKSSKEPTLVVKAGSSEKFAGGVLAVANHVANFVDEVGVVTYLGEQNSEEDFIKERLSGNVHKHFLYKDDSPTIVKRRFVDSYFFTKLLEVYEINDSPLNEANNQQLCKILKEQLPNYDLAIVLDFGHGMLSREAKEILAELAPFLALNVQANAGNLGYHTISAYPKADYISIAENEVRLEARDREGELKPMVLHSAETLNCGRISVTRGKHGCFCYSAKEGSFEVPAVAGEVVDRIGAGDAFLSITALCVAQDAPMEVVGFVGNAVGALAVSTVGNRTQIGRDQLYKYIRGLLERD